MAAHGIGRPLLFVWHPAVGLSSRSKDYWHSPGTWGETPTTNLCPPLQGPYKLLSCPYSLYSANLCHLPLECSVRIMSACASKHSAVSPWSIAGSFLHLSLCLANFHPRHLFSNLWSFEAGHYESDFSQSTNNFSPLLKKRQQVCPNLMLSHSHSASSSAMQFFSLSQGALLPLVEWKKIPEQEQRGFRMWKSFLWVSVGS